MIWTNNSLWWSVIDMSLQPLIKFKDNSESSRVGTNV